MAELLMWSVTGLAHFSEPAELLNGFSNRGFASVNGLAKQRFSPPGVSGICLMVLMDQ